MAAISMPGVILSQLRDADQGVGAMGVHHVLDAVGDEIAAGQGIEHAAVAHGDAVVDGDGVELTPQPPAALMTALHPLANVVQVNVAGHELGEAVDDGDDGLFEIRSVMPLARHRARAPAMLRPWVVVRLRYPLMP